MSQNKTVPTPSPVRFFPIGTKHTSRCGSTVKKDPLNLYVDFDKPPLFQLPIDAFTIVCTTPIEDGRIYLVNFDMNIEWDLEKLDSHKIWLTRCKGFKRSKIEVDIFSGNVKRARTKKSVSFKNEMGAIAVLPLDCASKILEESIDEGMAIPVNITVFIIQDIC